MKVAVIGLGYVGLPLAVELAKNYEVIGYDIDQSRVDGLNEFNDYTDEIGIQELIDICDNIIFTTDARELQKAGIYIITVPTPVDSCNHPDLTPLIKSSETVGSYLSEGNLVIYESTVYPTATEEVCIPLLIENSGLKLNDEFGVGYSPERINPADKVNTLLTITKVVSGSNDYWRDCVKDLYESIGITTFQASSLKVAEASKVIENVQRDVNIALVNELSVIFSKMDINTQEVLDAAGTKWNFLPFRPGLVGGHCIGVDPYYLMRKSEQLGYSPEIIKNSRITNENMANFIVTETLQKFKDLYPDTKPNILIMGITFKENCPDLRNSKVFDMMDLLDTFYCEYAIHDPVYKRDGISKLKQRVYSSAPSHHKQQEKFNIIFLNVAHTEYTNYDYTLMLEEKHLIMDVKNILTKDIIKTQKLNVVKL